MIEHHFVVVYNRDTGHWYVDEEDITDLTNGRIYDTSLGQFRHMDDKDVPEDDAAWGWLAHALSKLSDETSKVVDE